MKCCSVSWMLALLLIGPALALDEGKPDTKAEKAAASKDAGDEVSPIPRLAEVRIDEYVVPARMINLPLPGKTKTLQDILDKFEKWSEDDKIGAVLLDLGLVRLSLPDVEELRAAIYRLKKAGKKVMAFVNAGTPQAYLLACAADEIATPPTGHVTIPGIGRVFPRCCFRIV